jgi:hypothetical protein
MFQNPSWQSFDISRFEEIIDIQAKCILTQFLTVIILYIEHRKYSDILISQNKINIFTFINFHNPNPDDVLFQHIYAKFK